MFNLGFFQLCLKYSIITAHVILCLHVIIGQLLFLLYQLFLSQNFMNKILLDLLFSKKIFAFLPKYLESLY